MNKYELPGKNCKQILVCAVSDQWILGWVWSNLLIIFLRLWYHLRFRVHFLFFLSFTLLIPVSVLFHFPVHLKRRITSEIHTIHIRIITYNKVISISLRHSDSSSAWNLSIVFFFFFLIRFCFFTHRSHRVVAEWECFFYSSLLIFLYSLRCFQTVSLNSTMKKKEENSIDSQSETAQWHVPRKRKK